MATNRVIDAFKSADLNVRKLLTIQPGEEIEGPDRRFMSRNGSSREPFLGLSSEGLGQKLKLWDKPFWY
jgi:hypothetical protein